MYAPLSDSFVTFISLAQIEIKMYLKSRSLKRLFSIGKNRSIKEEDEKMKITYPATPLPTHHNDQYWKPTLTCFSYQEIYKATQRFHPDNLVGRGGYAEVYKGVMEDGCVIAVKRQIRALPDYRKEKEFLTEIGIVGHARHPNVSALLGCCIDEDLHLVFHLSERGSVSSNLHDENSQLMPWEVRYKIAVGTAHGLHYLHNVCQRRIIHRDIKASNILLTSNFDPQISDFGLAKWIPLGLSHRAVGPIEGTFGCLAPEYFMHGIVDEKTDVFAFGVFLLEVMSGRKPVDGYHKSLLSWAKPHLTDEKITMLVDSRLGDNYEIEQLMRLVLIASLCIRTRASWRPSMAEVLDLLEDDEISHERWKMPEEDAEEEFWSFDDLDSDLDERETPSSCSSMCSLIHREDQEN